MKELNRIVILGTGDRGKNGEVCTTRLAENSVHKAVEVAAEREIPLSKKKLFLIANGYDEELFKDGAPPNSGASAMRDFALNIYERDGLTKDSFLIEDTSTNVHDSIANSLARHPKFFRKTALGKRGLGLVSHEDDAEEAAKLLADKLSCPLEAITQFAIRRSMYVVPDLSKLRGPDLSLQPTGDD